MNLHNPTDGESADLDKCQTAEILGFKYVQSPLVLVENIVFAL
jgi:hypothetical protein